MAGQAEGRWELAFVNLNYKNVIKIITARTRLPRSPYLSRQQALLKGRKADYSTI